MEGSVAASSSERLRHAVQRYRAIGAAQSDERLQGLFEQLLNVPTAFTQVAAKPADADQDKPSEPTDDAPAATSKSKASSESDKADDKPDDSDQDDAQGVSAEAAGAAASAAAQAAVAPVQVTATEVKVDDKSAKGKTSDAPVTVTAQVSTAVAKESSTTGDAVTTTADATTVAKSAEPESVVCPAEQVQAVSKDNQIVNAKEATQVRAPEAVKQTQNSVHVEGKTKGEQSPKEATEVKAVGLESIAAKTKTDKPEVKEGHHETVHHQHEQNDEQNTAKSSDSTVPTQGAASKSKGDGDRPERREKWFERDADAPKGIDASLTPASTNDIPQAQPGSAWSGSPNDPSLNPAAGATAPSDASVTATVDANAGADLAASIASVSGASSSTASVSTDGSAGHESGRTHVGHSSIGQIGSATSGSSSSSAVNVAGRPSTVTGGSGRAAAAGKADPTDKGQDVPGLSQMERVRLVQRVARSFNRLGADGGQVTLRLHPPELGVLNVTVKIEGNTLSAKLQTESTAAQQALLENLPQLKDKLAEQGVEVTRFQVEVSPQRDWSAGANSSNTGNQNSSSSGDEARSREIDYRRLNRSAYDASAVTGAVRSTRAGWDSPSSWSAANRSLDVEV
ncbi:MAG: flagellar hook-length control protein FliK [Pirellulales bacterium]